MALPNIFSKEVSQQIIKRIDLLDSNSKPLWGKMDAAKMLAHCNVTYEMAFENIHPKPNFLVSLMLKTFVKKQVTSDALYPKNSRTAPAFIINSQKDFQKEKQRLLGYIQKTVDLGEDYFQGKESLSFGKLSKEEWNNMFYKHLDHHLNQFGV
ncbi:MAG: hypothetical protein C4K58_06445 [Flavobacteriaceae bacterium]|nr:MAG: hypothetical protein C4K58_06445 [Flavobacteriaceae bacterium]